MSEVTMRAISLWQPWAWALFHGKPLENRTWALPDKYLGERLCIHAGKVYDGEGELFVRHQLGVDRLPAAARARGIIGTLVFDRVVAGPPVHCGDAIDPEPLIRSRWYFGPFGWVHRDAIELAAPIPCKGMLGIWAVPPRVAARVHGQPVGCRCCERGDEYNGFGSDGPRLFTCQLSCACHD